MTTNQNQDAARGTFDKKYPSRNTNEIGQSMHESLFAMYLDGWNTRASQPLPAANSVEHEAFAAFMKFMPASIEMGIEDNIDDETGKIDIAAAVIDIAGRIHDHVMDCGGVLKTRKMGINYITELAANSVEMGDVERPECCEPVYKNASGPWRNEELPEGFRVQNRIFSAGSQGKAICTITARSFAEADYYARLIITADKAALAVLPTPSIKSDNTETETEMPKMYGPLPQPKFDKETAEKIVKQLAGERDMKEEQIEYMTTRFLNWKLPEKFRPDAGVTFTPLSYQDYEKGQWLSGTNLFDYTQAKMMVRHMLDGLPASDNTDLADALARVKELEAENRTLTSQRNYWMNRAELEAKPVQGDVVEPSVWLTEDEVNAELEAMTDAWMHAKALAINVKGPERNRVKWNMKYVRDALTAHMKGQSK